MAQPRLVRPVWIYIAPRDTAATMYDEYAREPIGNKTEYSAAFRIRAQIRFQDSDTPDYKNDEDNSRLSIMLRYKDIEKLSYTPSRGDKVTKIGRQITNVFMDAFEPCGHYADKGGSTLMLITLVENEVMQ